MKNTTMLTALVAVLALGGQANAQTYSSRSASLRPYMEDIWQARIVAVTQQTLLAYRVTEKRYELGQVRLTSIAQHREQGRAVAAGGRYELAYRSLEIALPALTETANSYADALESILRRAQAGERFNVAEADRFLREAQFHLLLTHRALQQWEQQIRTLDLMTYRLTCGQ